MAGTRSNSGIIGTMGEAGTITVIVPASRMPSKGSESLVRIDENKDL
jgi:hypothetical protein